MLAQHPVCHGGTSTPPSERIRDRDSAGQWRSRDRFGVATAHAVSALSRRTGHGGTALPGMVAERVAPGIASRIAQDLGSAVLISGTNGKTTTSHLLAHILERTGRRVVANRSGANLRQAFTSSVMAQAGLDGRLSPRGAVGVFEVDEAALGSVADAVDVSQLIMLNLFRDQLDRFGETDAIVRNWSKVYARLPTSSVVVSCADDPRLAHLLSAWSGPSLEFGWSRAPARSPDLSLTPDVPSCPRCDQSLSYAWTSVGHLGDFACTSCGFQRREPTLGVRVTADRGIDGQDLVFRIPRVADELTARVSLPGAANAYNAAAALAAAVSIGVPAHEAVGALADAHAAFGRYEELDIDGRRVVLTLGKNPASLAELARVAIRSDVAGVLFAVNDGFADGQDVSWYWDVNVGSLLEGRQYLVSGSRAPDLLLRLKYGSADVGGAFKPGGAGPVRDPVQGLGRLIGSVSRGGTIFVIATYTALLELRRHLVDRALLPAQPR